MWKITFVILGMLLVSKANALGTEVLALKLVAPVPVLKASQGIVLPVITTNISDHDISYDDTSTNCDFSVSVTTSSGTPAPETEFKRQLECGGPDRLTGRNIHVALKPGESESSDVLIHLKELFDMSAPGTYSVQVSRIYPNIGKITSNSVDITVTP